MSHEPRMFDGVPVDLRMLPWVQHCVVISVVHGFFDAVNEDDPYVEITLLDPRAGGFLDTTWWDAPTKDENT